MSNLLKRGTTINKDERVIDYNELIRQKLQKIMDDKQGRVDPDGFVNGLQADVVQELISDDTVDSLTDDYDADAQAAASLEEINDQAAQIIGDAETRAQEIIDNANMEADRIADEARMSGYAEGSARADADIEQKRIELEEEYNRRKEQLEDEYEKLRESVEPELVDIITEVFRKVTHVVSEDNHDIILHLINDVMHNAEGNKEFTIKVSPEDYRFLVNNQGKIYCAMSREVNIDIVEDTTMKRNECMIETGTGIFNCSLDIELDNVIKNIKLLSCI